MDKATVEAWEEALGAIRALLQESHSAIPVKGWQPIETAPKDGRTLFVARDMGESWGWVLGTSYWCYINNTISGWISRGLVDPPGELGLGAPTHWMPLPDPPAQPLQGKPTCKTCDGRKTVGLGDGMDYCPDCWPKAPKQEDLPTPRTQIVADNIARQLGATRKDWPLWAVGVVQHAEQLEQELATAEGIAESLAIRAAHTDSQLLSAQAALEAARKDAARWLHARKYVSADEIQRWKNMDANGHIPSDAGNTWADEKIDAAIADGRES